MRFRFFDVMNQGCRQRAGGAGRVSAPQILADHLTLYQPEGGHIISTLYYKPLRIFRPCDGPVIARWSEKHTTKKIDSVSVTLSSTQYTHTPLGKFSSELIKQTYTGYGTEKLTQWGQFKC